MKKSTFQFLAISTFIFFSLMVWASVSFGQDLAKYKGQMFEVKATSEDVAQSRYFIELPDSTRLYLSKLDGWEKPVDNGDGTATYKKEVYTINVGVKNGRYIITKSGNKMYIPKLVN